MEKNPKAAERLVPLLIGNEDLFWAAEIELPKKGMGCLVFGLVITSILSLSFLTEGNFYGLFFMFISIF
ncbi:MAG: hypothetical protein GY810_31490, partial [Aureispira sp.]|nr:hypothetical protein [Aureispira sp.]